MKRNQFLASLATLPFVKLESPKEVVKIESDKYEHVRTKLIKELFYDYAKDVDFENFDDLYFYKMLKNNFRFKTTCKKYNEDGINKIKVWYQLNKKTWITIEITIE